ncbi:MFS transporter [Desulfocurvibacter africanus]|uniref:MFS transporter n=1 Tax=Desulfocurvibacter africanus TaxID=873 RepID=UPI002FDA7DC8
MDASPRQPDRLLSFEFVALSAISFLAFCNLSIFYGFNAYLERQGIDPAWRGALLALEPAAAFALRPIIGPLLNLGNGVRVMGLGLATVMAALAGYSFAEGLGALVLVRVLHGVGFVLLVSAVISVLVHYVPKERSGQGFGVFSIMTLLPYALMPPLVESLLPGAGDEAGVYLLAAPLFLPAFLLLVPLGRRARALAAVLPRRSMSRPSLGEIRADLRSPGVARLLLANLFVFTATTVVFFHMKDHLAGLGSANPGLFFSIFTAATILVRVACGPLLDRVNRAAMLAVVLPILGLCLYLFGAATEPAWVMALAGLYGVCLGFIMPQLNAAMFVISPPHLRGLNTNLMLFTMDGGYWLGPLLAGFLSAGGMGYTGIFGLIGTLPLVAGVVALSMARLTRKAQPAPA